MFSDWSKPGRPGSGIDTHVGKRVGLRRKSLGISREQLAERVQLRLDDINRFEAGTSRLSAGTLFLIAGVLDVPVEWFYVGYGVNPHAIDASAPSAMEVELLDLFRRAPNDDVRQEMLALARVLVEHEQRERTGTADAPTNVTPFKRG